MYNRGNLLYDAGRSTWGSVATVRGGRGWEVGRRFKRERTYIYSWLIHADVWQKPTQHCKTIIFHFKINALKKKCLKDGNFKENRPWLKAERMGKNAEAQTEGKSRSDLGNAWWMMPRHFMKYWPQTVSRVMISEENTNGLWLTNCLKSVWILLKPLNL